MGQAPTGDTYNTSGKGLPLIAGAGDFGETYPSPKKFTTGSNLRTSLPGDVVIGIRASIGDKVLADGVYCLGRGVAGLRAGPQLDPRYLWNWISHAAPTLAAKGRGATFLQVNKNDIAELVIPMPSLEEQRRIASILDAADLLRTKRRQALEKLDSLSQSVFVEMFGDGATTPVDPHGRTPTHNAGWVHRRLVDVAELATGHTPDRKIEDFWNGDVSWVNLNEIREHDGRVCSGTEARITDAGVRNSSAVVLPAGTVCFSRTASIGFVTVMGMPMATSQDFVNWICGDELNPRYLMDALVMSRSALRASSSGSTHKTIYMRDAERFTVLLPPRELQDGYVARVEAIDNVRGQYLDSNEDLEELYASLQHRAFRGAL